MNSAIGRRIAVLSLLIVVLVCQLYGQEAVVSPDAFQRQVPSINLEKQTIVDGAALVGQNAGLSVSVEYPLAATISQPAPQLQNFSAILPAGTVSTVLDSLCELDPTFTWLRIGNAINLIPRAVANDSSYFLNRKADAFTFENLARAQDAVFKAAEQLPGPKEQIAILQTGMPLDFPRPWTATLKNITVRQVFDDIALQFGPTYGWQFNGAKDFRMITFHEVLQPRREVARPRQPGSPIQKH